MLEVVALEERHTLERIVEITSGVGTAGIIIGAAGILSQSPSVGVIGLCLFETGYFTALIAAVVNKRMTGRATYPEVYLPHITTVAGIIDAIYLSYVTFRYSIPHALWMIERAL